MKHLEVRQKYSTARRIFNSLLGVSSGDETLHLMFDILHHVIGQLTRFHLNGQTKGFHSQVQKSEVHFNFVLTILLKERSMTVTTK